jgi:phosphate transport system permease protein
MSWKDWLLRGWMGLCSVAVVAIGVWLVGVVLWAGLPELGAGLFQGEARNAGREGGILSVLVATLYLLGIGLGVALPVGLLAAVGLAEFELGGKWVRSGMDVLAAVPSVVWGLFGIAVLCEGLNLGWSLLSGGLTVAGMILPLFVRLCEEGLRATPDSWREAGRALGLSKTQLLLRIQLPAIAPSMAAALALASGRVIAESAIFLFTAGSSLRMPEGPLDPGRSLALHVYLMAIEVPGGDARAAACAALLVGLVMGVTGLAIGVGRLKWALR